VGDGYPFATNVRSAGPSRLGLDIVAGRSFSYGENAFPIATQEGWSGHSPSNGEVGKVKYARCLHQDSTCEMTRPRILASLRGLLFSNGGGRQGRPSPAVSREDGVFGHSNVCGDLAGTGIFKMEGGRQGS